MSSGVNMYYLSKPQSAMLAQGPGQEYTAEIDQFYEGRNMISSTQAARTDSQVTMREQQEFAGGNYFMDQVISPASIMNCSDANRLGGRPNKNLSGQYSSCYAAKFPRQANATTIVEYEWEAQRDPSRHADSLAFSGIPPPDAGKDNSSLFQLLGAPPRKVVVAGSKGCASGGDMSMCGLTTFGNAYNSPPPSAPNFYAPLPNDGTGNRESYQCGVTYNKSGSSTQCSVRVE